MAALTACSIFASSNTTSGDLPPSSMVTSFNVPEALATTFLPVPTSPVNDTLSISLCAVSHWPTSPAPCTTLNTPAGTPASTKISASLIAPSGVSSDGLNINALPAARAGPDFQHAICSG